MKITKLTTSRPGFLVASPSHWTAEELQATQGRQAGYQVTVEVKPGMPLGRFQEELVIETDHPLKSEIKVRSWATVTGPITVIPERLRMSNVSSSQGASRDMMLLVRGGTPTKFTVVRHPEKVQVDDQAR